MADYGVMDIKRWKFDNAQLPEVWANHLGNLAKNARIYISGDPGHGKSEYCMQYSKVMSQHVGKVHYNNVEQGKHEQIHQSWERNNFETEVKPGKWMYGKDLRTWDKYLAKVRKNGARVLILDSISYWETTYAQVKELHEMFPNRMLVFVGYKADKSKHAHIRHLCDTKIDVENFEAKVRSRFGGNKSLIVYQEGYEKATGKKAAASQLSIFNQ